MVGLRTRRVCNYSEGKTSLNICVYMFIQPRCIFVYMEYLMSWAWSIEGGRRRRPSQCCLSENPTGVSSRSTKDYSTVVLFVHSIETNIFINICICTYIDICTSICNLQVTQCIKTCRVLRFCIKGCFSNFPSIDEEFNKTSF